MAYQAIYRKWRPQVFEDIIGQGHITKTLKNQIVNDRISHAYLFCGTRGTGKTTAAKVFAKAVNCLNPKDGSPCNECEICKGIQNGSIMDVTEIDAASNNSVDNIRDLREDVNYVATQTKYSVYIIDEVHMLTTGAFNALLKTLEEPPAHVIFILATTEVHKIPETILSRCQRFDFRRITPSDIIVRMKEIATADGINITEDAYAVLAQMADGSMRDGLSVLERCVSACGNNIDRDSITSVLGITKSSQLFSLADAIISGSSQDAMAGIDMVCKEGRDLNVFCDSLIKHFRDLLICKVTKSPQNMVDYSDDLLVKLRSQSEGTSFEKLSNATTVLTKAKADAKWVKNPRVIYELALIKLTRPELDSSEEALLDRLSKVEEAAKNGITVTTVVEEKKEIEEEVKKDEVSARLFAPIDKNTLTSTSPIVVAARNWERIASGIGNDCPYLAAIISKCKVNIDGEGILLLFNQKDKTSKNITVKYIDELNQAFRKYSKTNFKVKAVFEKDVEDALIDYWNLPKGESDTPLQEHQQPILLDDEGDDPLDNIARDYPEIVSVAEEISDDVRDVDKTVQEELFNSDTEEFLDEGEILQIENEE